MMRDQRMDVYIPADARDCPVLFLVHGGGWRRGDKAHGRLIDNKLAHWLPAGVIVVSINYRMLPEADVLTQRDDVVAALAGAGACARVGRRCVARRADGPFGRRASGGAGRGRSA
jgi:arylformamidase